MMKLYEKYPYQEMYEKTCLRNITLPVLIRCFELNLLEKISSDTRICESGSQKIMPIGGNDAKLMIRKSKSSTLEMKILIDFLRGGISGIINGRVKHSDCFHITIDAFEISSVLLIAIGSNLMRFRRTIN
jgi:hypothetical protein